MKLQLSPEQEAADAALSELETAIEQNRMSPKGAIARGFLIGVRFAHDSTQRDRAGSTLSELPVTTLCSECGHLQEFKRGKLGHAWLRVEVQDGGDTSGPTLSAEFCSPTCVAQWFGKKSNTKTIVFPRPCDCGSNGKDHIPGCAALKRPR